MPYLRQVTQMIQQNPVVLGCMPLLPIIRAV